jgi:hypothetical protein
MTVGPPQTALSLALVGMKRAERAALESVERVAKGDLADGLVGMQAASVAYKSNARLAQIAWETEKDLLDTIA